MPIGPGSRIGPYEITSFVASGGMGEVWRARHSSLKRDDALKVLPDTLAADPHRLARFQREAEVLASLNHPNIAHVHGLEESGAVRVLVMELVDGPTLADLIRQGPLPIDRALAIARQIALGLEAAHERSIVHRDLKPANVKVRPDGVVKILDFGLAKVFQNDSSSDVTDDVTLTTSTGPLTREGVIVGTIAYMSPEQARGERVDARADIWAFGCVLYEMLTGRRAFGGPSAPDVVAAVLTSTPDWSQLPAEVPQTIRALLRRCLARDPARRLKHMSSALLMLDEDALAGSDVAPTVWRPPRPRWPWALAAVSTLLLAGALTAAWWGIRSRPLARVVRSTIAADTLMSETDRNFALTPDGSRIVYIGEDSGQILVRDFDSLTPVSILKTPRYVRGPVPSPDGQWIAYVENAFFLRKIAVAGGATAGITQMDGPSRGLAWGPDGTIVFATGSRNTGLQQVSISGGPVTVLTRPQTEQGESDHIQPVWLPDGRHLLFTVVSLNGGPDARKVAVLDLASRTWRTVIDGGYAARYVEGGYLVYAAAGALWGIRFDASTLKTQGAAFKLPDPLMVAGLSATALFDVGADGTLLYARDVPTEADSRTLVLVDRNGQETPLSAPPSIYRHPRLSPKGDRLAISVNGKIVVWPLDRPWSARTQLPSPPSNDWYPVWRPDGRRLIFGSWRGGGFSNLYAQEPGTPDATRLTDSPDMQLPTSISPDGNTVIFHSFTKGLDALQLDASGPARQRVLVETPREERNGALSPDGHWLAYEAENATKDGQLEIVVRPFPATDTGFWQVTTDGGLYPAWSGDSHELFYLKLDGTLVAVPVQPEGSMWNTGEPKDLFKGPYFYQGDGSLGREYDVAPNGQRFIMIKNSRTSSGPGHFVLVQNWIEELKKAALRH